MGLIDDRSRERDHEVVLRLAKRVSSVWNTYGTDYGFQVVVSGRAVEECCDEGNQILKSSFSVPPGPFKRVGALVVLARLKPLFDLRGSLTPGTKGRWLSRVVALLIPAALRLMAVNVSTHESAATLRRLNWHGFASPHVKFEFLALLEWLDLLDDVQAYVAPVNPSMWNRVVNQRLARMVLALSLEIESNYYCTEEEELKIRGQCKACFRQIADLTCLSYDERIWEKAMAVRGPNVP